MSARLRMNQVARQAGAYPGFCSTNQLGVFLLLPRWDACLFSGLPPSNRLFWQHPFIHLGGERHCKSQLSLHKNTMQCSRLGLEPRLVHDLESTEHTNNDATAPSTRNRPFAAGVT